MANSIAFRSGIGWIVLIAGLAAGIWDCNLYAQQAATQQMQQNKKTDTSWQVEPYVQGGFLPPNYQYSYDQGQTLYLSLDFYSAGIALGKETHRIHAPLRLTGRAEALLEVTPFWLARYPAQTITVLTYGVRNPAALPFKVSATNYFGASTTPFLIRWNFSERNGQRVIPWLQLGGGLLWTDHKFPELFYPIPVPANDTSVINFTPQVGAGVNIFHGQRHSADLAVKFIHISSAGLGDRNPGLDYTIQFAAGYSWWK